MFWIFCNICYWTLPLVRVFFAIVFSVWDQEPAAQDLICHCILRLIRNQVPAAQGFLCHCILRSGSRARCSGLSLPLYSPFGIKSPLLRTVFAIVNILSLIPYQPDWWTCAYLLFLLKTSWKKIHLSPLFCCQCVSNHHERLFSFRFARTFCHR